MAEPTQTDWTLDDIQKMADITSVQGKTANRYWLSLIVVSIFLLIPRTTQEDIQLPFGLGECPPPTFYLIGCVMVSVILISFMAAHAQQLRAVVMAGGYIDTLSADKSLFHPKDLYDMARSDG